ncbi:hypothetical protein [Streptomyces sp. NPDC008121]|uniref:hypothetical protein n=1 Tax=Streptomyces sp. NPDC008121 TaxID=3364809 RepID=UPI0036DFB390
MTRRWGQMTAGVAAVVLLASLSTTAAQAVPAADPVDVRVYGGVDRSNVAPGAKVGLRATAGTQGKGTIPHLGLTITLPEGVSFDGNIDDATSGSCVAVANGRTLTCTGEKSGPTESLSVYVRVKFAADLAHDTELDFTVTADIGDTVDPRPENNSATAKAAVRAPADLGLTWTGPSGPVAPGEKVPTKLVVTNHGPATVTYFPLVIDLNWDLTRPDGYDKSCWAAPSTLTCDAVGELKPGESRTFPFVWEFPQKTPGATHTIGARLGRSDTPDANAANDEAALILKIGTAPGPKPTKPTPTAKPSPEPTGTPTPSASATTTAAPGPTTPVGPGGSGGALAATGADSVTTAAGAAVALTLAGGTLLVARRRFRHRI